MTQIVDPLRALVVQIEKETNEMRSLLAFLNSALLLVAGRTSLKDAAYHLVKKVDAHPNECVSHEKAIEQLHSLADKTAASLHQLADHYEKLAPKERHHG